MKLAVIADYAEEGWPSMDLCASELMRHLPSSVSASLIQPKMKLRLSRLPGKAGHKDSIHILDRLWNRQWDYPRYLGKDLVTKFDTFHVVDHSYAAVVHSLPGARTGVYCHDLDAFRSILEPKDEKRPLWFRAMSWRILNGLKKSAIVFHNSLQTGEALRRFAIVPNERLIHAPLGTAVEFCAKAKSPPSSRISEEIEKLNGRQVLLHVGSNIPRKQIDVLLRVLCLVKQRINDVLLLKVGDPGHPSRML